MKMRTAVLRGLIVLNVLLMCLGALVFTEGYATDVIYVDTGVGGTTAYSLNTFRWQSWNLSTDILLGPVTLKLKGNAVLPTNVTLYLRNSTSLIASSNKVLIPVGATFAEYNFTFTNGVLPSASAYGAYNISALQDLAIGVDWNGQVSGYGGGESSVGSGTDLYLIVRGNPDVYSTFIVEPVANSSVFNANMFTLTYYHNSTGSQICSHFLNSSEYIDGATAGSVNVSVNYTALSAGLYTFKAKCGSAYSVTKSAFINIGQTVSFFDVVVLPGMFPSFSVAHFSNFPADCVIYFNNSVSDMESFPAGTNNDSYILSNRPPGIYPLNITCADDYGVMYSDSLNMTIGAFDLNVSLYRYVPNYVIVNNSLTTPKFSEGELVKLPAAKILVEGATHYCADYSDGVAQFVDVIGEGTYTVSLMINGDCAFTGESVISSQTVVSELAKVYVDHDKSAAFIVDLSTEISTGNGGVLAGTEIGRWFFIIWQVAFVLVGLVVVMVTALVAQRNWPAAIIVGVVWYIVLGGMLKGAGLL